MDNIYEELLKLLEKTGKIGMITSLGKTIEKKLISANDLFDGLDEKLCEEYGNETGAQLTKALTTGQVAVIDQADKKVIIEPFCREERMIICGGGHISLALGEFAAKVGFSVVVIDDRPSFANSLRFPFASQVICDGFESAIESLGVNEEDYLVIVTRGHKNDAACLRGFSKCPQAKYVGMIGSRKRVAAQMDLLEEEGISRDWLNSVHTPIGLSIGAVTPEEIAIAILAEIIQVKRTSTQGTTVLQSDIDMDVIHKLAYVPAKRTDSKKSLVTIIKTSGSAPRKAGAKMIVYEDGLIEGTVGGGCAEAALTGWAVQIAREGGYKVVDIDLSNDVAADAGMVCGGSMTFLIEAI